MTAWCQNLIQNDEFEFYCPAIIDANRNKQCKRTWTYDEVRKIALLSQSEREYFEKKLSKNAAKFLLEIKECPRCHTFVERQDQDDLCVRCTVCRGITKRHFEFCWQCGREWSGLVESTANDTCGRLGCENEELRALRDCQLIQLREVKELPEIPSIRACPTCGKDF